MTSAASTDGDRTMNLQLPSIPRSTLALILGAAALIGWSFFPTFDWMVEKWWNDPQYSHGFLVPLVSGYLLYRKWDSRAEWLGKPWPILAGVLLIAALALRFVGGGLLFLQLDAIALLVSLAALALLAGGGRFLKVTAPAIAFLIFMVPLPYEIERNVGGPLKIAATEGSVFLLQTLGFPAVPEGHVIHIDEVQLGVVDACSGLKMLMTFACFAAGAVLILDRTWFEKILVVLGIVPIAIISNVLRITATGVTYTFFDPADKAKQTFIHDTYGYPMIIVGLGFLAFQLWALGRLVVRVQPQLAPNAAFGMNVRVDAAETQIPERRFRENSALKV